ncbi:MAG: hypothetical protein ACXW1C_00355 [Gallionella sp.]
MLQQKFLSALFASFLIPFSHPTYAANDTELQALRDEVRLLAERIKQTQSDAKVAAPAASANAFNPAVSLILGGSYARLGQAPTIPATGFAMAANPAHAQGFNLGESELGLSADIDPEHRGVATMALAPAGGITVENAFIQSSALGNGLNVKFGRFFSGLGYLNEQHAHAWDFVDQPLVYASLWNNQIGEDGVQLKWLAPTETFVELGAEVGRGRSFPATDTNRNGAGATALFAHVADDIGVAHSWRLGASLYQTQRQNALSFNVPDVLGTAGGVSNRFDGNSQTAGLDVVWKYAPNGNVAERYLKLQGEVFQRKENGVLTYNLVTPSAYRNTQNGWYVQSVAQFMPHWRTGLRYDRLDAGAAQVGAANLGNVISNYGYNPTRTAWMLDYSPSEFARLRLQIARDLTRLGLPDNQIFVQYLMSLGAHGAHSY